MLYKREELYKQNLPASWAYFAHTTRDCLTYEITNYLKAMKKALREIIDDFLLSLQ